MTEITWRLPLDLRQEYAASLQLDVNGTLFEVWINGAGVPLLHGEIPLSDALIYLHEVAPEATAQELQAAAEDIAWITAARSQALQAAAAGDPDELIRALSDGSAFDSLALRSVVQTCSRASLQMLTLAMQLINDQRWTWNAADRSVIRREIELAIAVLQNPAVQNTRRNRL